MTRFVIAPQWQGSSSSRAMQLIDGAPSDRGRPAPSGDHRPRRPDRGGRRAGTAVLRASALARMRERISDAVASTAPGEHAVTVGGDCGVALGAVSAIAGDDLAIVWIDAHADLNTPESPRAGPSTAWFCARSSATASTLSGSTPPPPSRVVLAGTRSLDAEEQRFIDEHGIRVIPVSALSDPDTLAEAVVATGAARARPSSRRPRCAGPLRDHGCPSPNPSVRPRPMSRHPSGGCANGAPRGATITEFSPSSPAAAVEDLGTILRLVGALA